MQTKKAPGNGDILFKAHELINGQRQSDYGTPLENFSQIAEFWGVYLSRRLGFPAHVVSRDVANMMMLLKIARASNPNSIPTEDCYVDIAGYAGLANDFCEPWRDLAHVVTEEDVAKDDVPPACGACRVPSPQTVIYHGTATPLDPARCDTSLLKPEDLIPQGHFMPIRNSRITEGSRDEWNTEEAD